MMVWKEEKMKLTTSIPCIIFIFVIAALLLSCSQRAKEDVWQVELKKEGGTTTITNPENPKYGEIDLDFAEDLSIGNDDDPNFQFYRVSSIIGDNEENIYVLDAGNCRVQKFDRNGKYLMTFGRKGQGPGEFMNPSAFTIDDDGNLYVSDQMKIEVFDAEGEYKKNITLENRIYEFLITPEGYIITHTILSEGEGSKKVVVKLNLEGKIIATLAEFTDVESVRSNTEEGSTMTIKAYHQYNYWPYLYPSGADEFVYAYPAEYKIFHMNSNGEQSLIIQREIAENLISREEKNFIMNGIREQIERRGIQITDDVLETACQFPPHRPYFNRILLDDAGRIYVRNAGSVLDQNVPVQLDIFSKDGFYLYKTSFPFTPDVIRKGRMYDVFTSQETGKVEIKRYRIKNWSQLEE
jgi:hypothetical protein